MFMCRDPGVLRTKFHVVLSLRSVLKNSNFDAIVKVPVALSLKMSLIRKQKYGKS